MVTGTGDGAAMEKNTPVRSIRVDGPGAWRSLKLSTNSAETMCIAGHGSGRPPLAWSGRRGA